MLNNSLSRESGHPKRALPVCERILLDGFRSWARAAMTQDPRFSQDTLHLMTGLAGSKIGDELNRHLADYLLTLDYCRPSPLKINPKGCNDICRDEALMLSLVAGIQNDNEATVALCLDCLGCPACSHRIFHAAEKLATCLRLTKKNLLPVPVSVMRDILTRDISSPTLQ